MGALSFPIEFLSGSGGVTEAALAAIDAWDPTAISASTYSAVAGEARVFTHATGCDVTLPTGAANGSMIAVRTGHATGYVKFVTGGGSSKVQGGTTQISGGIGKVMVAQATANANEWNITGYDPEGPVYIGEYDTFDLLQASIYANGSTACYALPQNSWVSIKEFISGTGRGGLLYRSYAAAQADAHWTAPHDLILYQDAWRTDHDVVYPANVATSAVASASSGTKTRLTITAHLLTAASDGKHVYVSAGTNWTAGFYVMTYVDANNIDLDVAWNASFGNPTLTKATGSTQITYLQTITIPAKLRRKKSVLVAEAQFETSTISANKYTQVLHGSTQVHNGQIDTTNAGESVQINIRNSTDSAAQQIQQATSISASYTKTGAPLASTENTDNALDLKFGIDLPTANVWGRVAGITVKVRI